MKKVINYIKKSLASYLEVQLFITNMSLPILIWWGLPLSLMSPIGNALFSPILAGWLMLCSCVFLTELLNIPNSLLIYLLDLGTTLYKLSLSWNPSWSLIPFYKPPLFVLIFFALLTLYILHCTLLKNSWHRIIAYLCSCWLLIICSLLIRLYIPAHIQLLACPPGNLSLIVTPKGTHLVDPGFINKNWSDPAWIEYQLLPDIIKHSGTDTLETFATLRTTKKTIENLYKLVLPLIHINNLYCCFSNYEAMKKCGAQLYMLFKECQNYNVSIQVAFRATSYQLARTKKCHLTLQPEHTTARTKALTWVVKGSLNQEAFTICDRRHKTFDTINLKN